MIVEPPLYRNEPSFLVRTACIHCKGLGLVWVLQGYHMHCVPCRTCSKKGYLLLLTFPEA